MGQLLIVIYIGVTTIITLSLLAEGSMELNCINPFVIYEDYNVNWFGCIVLTILFHAMVGPVWAFGYWFYKLCTVGRKDD